MAYFKLFQKVRFSLILIWLSLTHSAFSQQWPTLYTQEDIIPQKKEDLKRIANLNSNDIAKMPPDKVRDLIYQSFYFIADFLSSTKGELPKGWFDSTKDPEKSLIYGFPPELKRPPLNLFFPAYNLKMLGNFISDDPYISELNVCQGFWHEGRLQKAYDCFFFLQMELAKDKIPVNSLVRTVVNILHGFFFLHLATNDVKDVHIWNAKTIPPSPQEFTEGDHYAMARVIFSYVATQVDDSLYLPKQKTNVIENVYKHLLEYPVYFKVSTKISNKRVSVTMLPEHLDTLNWVQTVMPVVYANTMAMNQGILLWQRAFNSAFKLESYMKQFNFPNMPQETPLKIFDRPLVKTDIYLSPKNNTDLLVTSDLFRASAMLNAKDPGKALEYIAAGILKKGDPEISSLLFTLSANAYFDLDLLRWARRSYSWAELFSPALATKAPSSLFYGAETAFWLGNYGVAKKAFTRFQTLIGDPEYSPWAYLRLAEISEREGNNTQAKNYYEVILRKFDQHLVSADAQVRLFCLYQSSLSKNARKVEYNKVVTKIKNAREALKKQAKACLLKVDLDLLQAGTSEDAGKSVVERSLRQKNVIESYTKEFPDSEFITLFTSRVKELELAEGTYLATENECFKLIAYYKKNKPALQALEKNNHGYVKGLKWDQEDKRKLLRCSAFVKDYPMWQEMRRSEIGNDGEPLHTQFYDLMRSPSVKNALLAYNSLKNNNNQWNSKLSQIEKATFSVILKEEFWEMLTLRELIKFDLLASRSANNLLNSAISQDLFQDPKLIFSSKTFCFWMLRTAPQFNHEKWIQIAKTKDKSEWAELLESSSPKSVETCPRAFAKALFTFSLKNPDSYLDERILIPYLEKKGVENAGEEWLQYVQRIEKKRGIQDPEVQRIYRNLSKGAKDALVKEAAEHWFKKNMPDQSDKLLW